MVLVLLTAIGIAGLLSAIVAVVASEIRHRGVPEQKEIPVKALSNPPWIA